MGVYNVATALHEWELWFVCPLALLRLHMTRHSFILRTDVMAFTEYIKALFLSINVLYEDALYSKSLRQREVQPSCLPHRYQGMSGIYRMFSIYPWLEFNPLTQEWPFKPVMFRKGLQV